MVLFKTYIDSDLSNRFRFNDNTHEYNPGSWLRTSECEKIQLFCSNVGKKRCHLTIHKPAHATNGLVTSALVVNIYIYIQRTACICVFYCIWTPLRSSLCFYKNAQKKVAVFSNQYRTCLFSFTWHDSSLI